MKKITKYSSLLLLALSATAFTACDNGLEEFSKESPIVLPSERFNSKVHFVTRLTDAPLATSDAEYTAIDNYLVNTLQGKSGSWITILDRADAGNLAATMSSALNTKRWTAFAFNRFSSNTPQGSMLYSNKWMTEVAGLACGANCYITTFHPTMQGTRTDTSETSGEVTGTTNISFGIHYSTARFETAEQIAAFGGKSGVLKALYQKNMNFVMIGTVKNGLFDALKASTENVANHAFTVSKVSEGSAYTIFLLAEERFWGFTSENTQTLSNGITAHTINIMW